MGPGSGANHYRRGRLMNDEAPEEPLGRAAGEPALGEVRGDRAGRPPPCRGGSNQNLTAISSISSACPSFWGCGFQNVPSSDRIRTAHHEGFDL